MEIHLDLGFSEMGSHYSRSSFDSDVIFLEPCLAPRFRKLQTNFIKAQARNGLQLVFHNVVVK